jgi:RNA-directed DNA polymerase
LAASSYPLHIALGLARALLAGPRQLDGMAAQAAAALGARPAWVPDLCQALLLRPHAADWAALGAVPLARQILREGAFQSAFEGAEPPRLRRYILRPQRMAPAPLGLEHCAVPELASVGDVAGWLGLSPAELDWFTACPPRRQQAALAGQHYRWRWWPKPGGGVRLLEVPRPRLMALQRRVLHDLLDRLPVHEAAQGFVAGRGVLDHAQAHAGQAVLLHFDLRDFFGSVHAGRVHAVFATLGYPQGVCRALTALLTSRVPDPVLQRLRDDGLIDWQHAQRLRGAHLPQGAPTSPALANLCVFGLDLRLEGLAHSLGARYSRYADDLVLSGPAGLRGRAQALETRVAVIAREEGFRLNHRKTRVGTQAGAQRVCGVVVNQHPNLPRREFDHLKALLHRCALQGPSAHGGDALPDFRAHVLGRVAWATQVNPAKARRLHRLLERIDWER